MTSYGTWSFILSFPGRNGDYSMAMLNYQKVSHTSVFSLGPIIQQGGIIDAGMPKLDAKIPTADIK